MGTRTSGGDGTTKSPIKIAANIFISFIGAGVLGLPFAFKEGGILEGTVIMVCVGGISIKAMLLLIDCKYKLLQRTNTSSLNGHSIAIPSSVNGKPMASKNTAWHELTPNDKDDQDDSHLLFSPSSESSKKKVKSSSETSHELNYGDVGYHAMGPMGRTLVDVAILISQIGFCCAYLIFLSENLTSYMDKLNKYQWLVMLLPPLFMLTLLRSLRSLAVSSIFAQLSNLFAFFVVFWFDFEHIYSVRTHPKEISLEGMPFFFAVAIYCYEGAGMILSLEASLKKEIRHKFQTYFVSTMVAVTSLYIAFGIAGYVSFGAETNEIITLNLPHSDSGMDFSMVVKACLCISLFFTYPVMMFPVVKMLEKRYLPNAEENRKRANLLRGFLVVCTGLIVIAIPNFANLMALVGATCCTMLAFIMPGLFHMLIFKGRLTNCAWLFDMFLIVVGAIGAVIGTIDAFHRLYQDHASTGEGEFPEATVGTFSHTTSMVHSAITPRNVSSIIARIMNQPPR